MTSKVRVVLLVFEESPEVTDPAVVLPEAVASPELAVWSLVVVTDISLVVVTFVLSVIFELITFSELAPVVPIEPESLPAEGSVDVKAVVSAGELSTVALTATVLLFMDVPLPTSPEVVFHMLFAEPVLLFWSLLLAACRLFVV